MVKIFTSQFTDARHFQLLYLGSFLVLSFFLFDRTDAIQCTLVLCAAIFVQGIAIKSLNIALSSMKSAVITALGLCILLKTHSWETAVFASTIAIASKFLIRYKGKHIFNPVNFGLVITILLTQNAWISPGQWGSSVVILFVLGALGFLVLHAANRLDIAFTFLLSYGGLMFFKNVIFLDWPIDFWLHQMTNGTLMLFTFFMITDPMTTPNHLKGRILYALAIAFLSFLLSTEFYYYTVPIYVLFGMSLFTPIADRIWKAKKYEWKNSQMIKMNLSHSTKNNNL